MSDEKQARIARLKQKSAKARVLGSFMPHEKEGHAEEDILTQKIDNGLHSNPDFNDKMEHGDVEEEISVQNVTNEVHSNPDFIDEKISDDSLHKKVVETTDNEEEMDIGTGREENLNNYEKETVGHYICYSCSNNLGGQRYILKDDQSYCITCYEDQFANMCEACSKKIGTDSKDLSYKEKHWHERCFKCSDCSVSLVDKLFGSRNDILYCDNCYDEKFGAKCDLCTHVFKAGMKKLEWNGQQWHEDCFKCTECGDVIGCNSFMPKEGLQYCIKCFNAKFAPKCKQCSEAIMTGGVLYRNEPYHRNCFGCTECNGNLVGQKFTSRENQPFCADCFGRLFAKKCCRCEKPITGIGGAKFISFDGKHWHNDCFNCDGPNCNVNLVGRGFITDQQDILCPDCAKLPYTKREEMKQQEQIEQAS